MKTKLTRAGFWQSLVSPLSTIFIFCLTTAALQAQQPEADLLKIHEMYQNLKTYSVEIEQNVYPTYTSAKSVHQVSGKVRLGEDQYYSYIDGVEILQNDEYTIMANHDQKTLMIQDKISLIPKTIGLPPIDSFLTQCERVEFAKISERQHAYDLYFSEDLYSRIRMIFNPRTYHLDKVILYYANEDYWGDKQVPTLARLELEFRNPKLNQPIAASTFSSKRFFHSTTKQLRLQPAYASFRLHNYLR
ncbi:MAG: hypothetical protein AAFQ87_12030 [Bacteroidota bacterium]